VEALSAQIEELLVEDVDVLVLHGEFDAYSMPMLAERIELAIGQGHYELIIDMSDVSFVDVATVNRIARAMKDVYRHNGHLFLVGAQRPVCRVIELAGLQHAIKRFATRDEAIVALR
jgi:anti-anti-sigma factor